MITQSFNITKENLNHQPNSKPEATGIFHFGGRKQSVSKIPQPITNLKRRNGSLESYGSNDSLNSITSSISSLSISPKRRKTGQETFVVAFGRTTDLIKMPPPQTDSSKKTAARHRKAQDRRKLRSYTPKPTMGFGGTIDPTLTPMANKQKPKTSEELVNSIKLKDPEKTKNEKTPKLGTMGFGTSESHEISKDMLQNSPITGERVAKLSRIPRYTLRA